MPSYNSVQLMGNLTRDPEVRYTPNGTAVAELGMAISRKFKGNDGQMQEETTFVDITLWSKLAELASQYLKKGNPVFIQGRLQMDSWEDKQSGQKRSKLKVVGEVMQMLGGKQSDSGGQDRQAGQTTGQSQARPASGQRQQASQGCGQSRPQQTQSDPFESGPDYGGMSDDDVPFDCPHYLMVGGV